MGQRVYIDTSVIGGCYDEEFSDWSKALFKEFRQGTKIAVVSDLTRLELETAPEKVKEVLNTIPDEFIENIFLNDQSRSLAKQYLEERIVTSKHLSDARHIAIATVERVDILASWNFQEIVNLNRIRAFNAVNLIAGYPILEIRSPREVLDE